MKKILYTFTALLALSVISCGEKDSPINQEPSGPSGGDQPSSGTEISEISIPEKLSMDVDWTDGQLLVVTLTPASASMSDVTASITSGDDVIRIEKATGGFRVKPKKEGTASVKVSATKGSATSKTCAVTVTAPGISQAVELTSISLGSVSSVELADLTSKGESEIAQIPVTLEPSTAGISDVSVSSSDKDVHAELVNDGSLKLLVTIPSNTSHATTNARDAVVTLKAKKGPATSAKLTVGVRGHVTGLSIDAPAKFLEGKEIHFTYGETVKLTPVFTKTGQLKTGGDKVNYTCPTGLNVADNVLSATSSQNLTGASGSVSLKAQCGLSPTIEVKVHTYAVPTGFSIDSHLPEGIGNAFKVGGSYILSIKVLPENTARQYVSVGCSASTANLTYETTYTSNLTKLDIKAIKSTQYSESFTFTAGSQKETWTFYVNDYNPGDVKIGDYVYRTADNKGFRRSDGGLRAVGRDSEGKDWIRQNSVSSGQQSGEGWVGLVFDKALTFVDDLPSDMKAGLKGDDGVPVHVGVLAPKDAKTNGSSTTCNWGQLEITWSSLYPKPYVTNSNTYKIYLADKALKSKLIFFSYVENYVIDYPLPESGHTPWMLPSYIDAQFMASYAKVFQKNGAAMSGSYWTACCDTNNKNYAGAMKWSGNEVTTGLYGKTENYKLRPVFFL